MRVVLACIHPPGLACGRAAVLPVYPPAPQPLMRRNVVKYLLNELRRSVPGCSVTLFAQPGDVDFYTGLEFVADAEDVHGMAMIEDPEVGFHS